MASDKMIFWIENGEKKWDMVEDRDWEALGYHLLTNPAVDNHSIFIIPSCSIMNGIWLQRDTHKSNRVDFNNLHNELNLKYIPPVATAEIIEARKEDEERNGLDTKYGWISPDGKYFHCGYQGHQALADKICFGMVETNNAEHYLEEHGWCKIYKPLFEETYSVYIGGKHVLTAAQMKTLIKMDLDNANHISEMLCKE